MPRVIVFIFCLAFLFGAGGFVRTGMTLAAAGLLALGGYLLWGVARMFLGPTR